MEYEGKLYGKVNGEFVELAFTTEEIKKQQDAKFVEGKRAGARSFAKLVREMRRLQADYFKRRKQSILKKAQQHEAQVDRAVKAVLQ